MVEGASWFARWTWVSTDPLSGKVARAAVIGCGAMGRHHAHALATMEEVALVALADVIADSVNRVGEEVGVGVRERYVDFRTLLQEQHPDFVVVATQAPQHAEITMEAAASGVHVLCEKPLALNLVEADAMVKACQDAGVLLAINHLRRTTPAALFARSLVASGEVGEVLAVDIHDKGGRPVGNTLMEMATHYFDEARFVLGDRLLADGRRADDLEWVYAHLATGLGPQAHPAVHDEIVPSQVAMPTDRDCGLVLGERGTVLLGFAGEVQGVARFHNLRTADTDYEGIDVIGSEGSLALRGDFLKRLYRRDGHTFALKDQWQPVEVPGSAEYLALSYFDAVRELCRRMARDMVAAIDEGRDHISSGADGLVTLESVMAVYLSHQKGMPIRLPLKDRRHPLDAWQRAPGDLTGHVR